MALHKSITGTTYTLHWDAYYWNSVLVPQKSEVGNGYLDKTFFIHGDLAGQDLYVIYQGVFEELPAGVRTHADAVAWCERQFAVTERRAA